jgi:hypothetical protein
MQRCPAWQMATPQVQRPAEHVPTVPALQSSSASHWQTPAPQLKPVTHARPQAPQFAGSVVRSKHPDGFWQHVVGDTQGAAPLHWQAPERHRSPRAHAVVPQWQRAVAVSHVGVAPPGGPFALHWASTVQPHTASTHTSPCPAQLLLQLPQLLSFARTSRSHPSSAPELEEAQFAYPNEQAEVHRLAAHTRAATFVVEQSRSQAPQFSGSLPSACSQPSEAVLLQSPKPSAHVAGAQSPVPLQVVTLTFGSEHAEQLDGLAHPVAGFATSLHRAPHAFCWGVHAGAPSLGGLPASGPPSVTAPSSAAPPLSTAPPASIRIPAPPASRDPPAPLAPEADPSRCSPPGPFGPT